MRALISLLTVVLLAGEAQAQNFAKDHSNAAAIQANVAVTFVALKTEQSSALAKYSHYVQVLKTPESAQDGKSLSVNPAANFPTPTKADAVDKTAFTTSIATGLLFNLTVHEYGGPFGVGYTLIAEVTQPNADGNCFTLHPGGQSCVWRYKEHVGVELYRDSGELVWTLDALP